MKVPVLFLLCWMISGCSSPQTINTDYSISGSETFTLKLSSNPSTGYSWEWANRKEDGIVDTTDIKFMSNRPEDVERGAVGVGGTEEWTFKGMRPGVDSIIMMHWRSWDSATITTQTFTVKVK